MGKTVWLESPDIFVAKYTEIKLGLNWEFPPCWLVFIVLDGAQQAAREEKATALLLSCEPCEL